MIVFYALKLYREGWSYQSILSAVTYKFGVSYADACLALRSAKELSLIV